MILISKVRYRVLSLLKGSHHRTFRFFMLPSILYSSDVLSCFSLTFSYLRLSLRSPSRCASVKPLTFPFFANRKQRRMQGRNVMTPFKVFYGVRVLAFEGPLSCFSVPFPMHIFRRTDNKKCTRETHLILILTLYFVAERFLLP